MRFRRVSYAYTLVLHSSPAATQTAWRPAVAAEAPSSLTIPDALPVLPLRGGVVVFPPSVVPLLVGQPRSIQLVDDIMRRERLLVLVSQRNDKEQPDADDLYRVGTAAIVHQLARLPDGKLRVVIQGLAQALEAKPVPATSDGRNSTRPEAA
jgi:ATP-dependent Lon protease